jgi:thymidylate synthase
MSIEYELYKQFSNFWETDYQDLLLHVMDKGELRDDRTGVGTKSIFHATLNLDISDQIPVFTTKKVAWKAIVSELLWFLEGSTDERRLAEIHYGTNRESLVGKRTIWTDNADNQGKEKGYINTDTVKELGPVYGKQWRDWDGKDQIGDLIHNLKNNPHSRRHVLSAWNVSDLDKMSLPPCHMFAQFYVDNDGGLSCQLYQRSADLFLGVPFNIASYSLLTYILAKETDLKPKELSWVAGDAHIYTNHFDAVREQLSRHPRCFPKLVINKDKNIDNYVVDDFKLEGYEPYDAIPAPMAI